MKVSELVTDNPTKLAIEAKARRDAEGGCYVEPYTDLGGTYQSGLTRGALNHTYALAHGKRLARLQRMKERV